MKKTAGGIFDSKAVELLISPERWKIISSCVPPEESPIVELPYLKWAEKHHDRHGHRELLFSLKGRFFQSFKGLCYPCVPGSLFLFGPSEEHDVGYPRDIPPLAHLWMMPVKERIFVNIYHSSGRHNVVNSKRFLLGSSETEILVKALESIENDSIGMSDAWKRAKIVTAVSNIFLYVLDRSFSTEANSGSAEHQKKVIETIMRHMEDNIGNSQNLDKLARIAGYSKYHFFRMFKEYTGHTVHAYVNLCRIKALKRMRKEGMLQKNIASALGFSCPAAFANWQRKKLEPGE